MTISYIVYSILGAESTYLPLAPENCSLRQNRTCECYFEKLIHTCKLDYYILEQNGKTFKITTYEKKSGRECKVCFEKEAPIFRFQNLQA